MPTYQYACKECGHQFEVVQSFNDASLTDCPQCQGALRKLFGSVGVIFKGSGFYRTDSRSDSKSSSTSGASSSSNSSSNVSSNGSGSSAKSDAGSGSNNGGGSTSSTSTTAATPKAS
ncbi:putative FmdB family regulatory protein [Saccharomonospora amisosensis]|uniref:Putative FmdB family regulatory protein n=1 Tax=Saccharomonospora amisosensis TaxID=1128677 RepID=A0A7X5ZPP5_9PSEU|nr:FmdB family zinc ribbon protein [Saccharomonospora amisosensis]NIJ10465.1 putative FmdB family regulatory protein [Saccharomonospora amisosensis]